MARSIPVIYNQLLQAKNAQPNLSALNSTSQVSKWNLWLWIVAVGQNLFEQLCDLFNTNIEAQITKAPVYSLPWIQNMILTFQYNASTPQIRNEVPIELNGGIIGFYYAYTTPNNALVVITQCSVKTIANRSVEILVAVGSPPGPASGAVQDALKSDLPIWMVPGTQYEVSSSNPDQIYIQATVTYNASYSGVIAANMNAAIANYLLGLATTQFGGSFDTADLLVVMKGVTGVKDVLLVNVFWRGDNNIFVPSGGPPPTNAGYSGQKLVDAQDWVQSSYQMFAGYAISETTAGYTLNDSITYIAG